MTGNTANGNGYSGVGLFSSSGNTVARNTTDGNGYGVELEGDSHENSVERNTATANAEQGIRLYDGATENTIQDNTVSGNFIGMHLFVGPLGVGASKNTIQNNTATLNHFGIWVEQDCTGNSIRENAALTNIEYDLGDLNPDCDSNGWTNNTFATDLVAWASDGGPGTGCIQ